MRVIPGAGAAFCSPASAMQMLFAVRLFFFFFLESDGKASGLLTSDFQVHFHTRSDCKLIKVRILQKKNLNFSGFSRAPGEMRQEITR